MSRLDSVIRRLRAQQACLEQAAALIRGLPGPVFEWGLGNGRTYDHLCQLCPDREIFVFDRQVAAGADRLPDAEHLFLGDFHKTLTAAAARFERSVALIHSDIGTGDAEGTARIAGFLSGRVPAFLCPGGIVVSDQELAYRGAQALPLPEGVPPGRYYMYRAG